MEPDHVAQLGFQLRVGENLNVSTRKCWMFHLRQIRATEANEIPSRSAINRADQRDAPRCAGGLPMLGSRSPATGSSMREMRESP